MIARQSVEVIPLITLVGPPNAGKTTLFNCISGKNFKTVNYPGATVEYSIAKFHGKYNLNANVVDSPGIISLIPNSPDEKIAVNSLYNHPTLGKPDVVVAIIDSSQLSRHLLLVKQLIKAGFNVVVALTMIDMMNKKGYSVSKEVLQKELGVDVFLIDGRSCKGVKELTESINSKLSGDTRINKSRLKVFHKEITTDELLDTYKRIEEIEASAVYEYNGNSSREVFLDNANEELKILNKPTDRKVKYKLDDTTLKIDKILLHRVWGIFFFFVIMAVMFTSIFWLADPLMGLIDNGFGELASVTESYFGDTWYGDLLADGVISGTGSVLVFVPQIIILFIILGFLEDTGYLARGAMLIDKPLSKIGLNGKSFVPMLSGFACAIPAMMATRTIPNKRERLLTIFILPLISCSARLPVYTLLIAFLIPPGKAWIGGIALASIYIFSTSSSIIVAGIINKFRNRVIKETDNSSFILELPSYRIPKLRIVLNNTYHSAKVYINKAGPVIFTFSLVLWFLTYFPDSNPNVNTSGLNSDGIAQVRDAERLSNSYAADLGKIIQPFMTPLGMDWRVGVSLISAFAAREVFVSSLALIFKVTSDDEDLENSILRAMRTAEIDDSGKKLFTTSTIVGLIVFFVFALQCMSTLAVSRKETGGWRIPILQLIMFSSLAYFLAFITVNGLRLAGVS